MTYYLVFASILGLRNLTIARGTGHIYWLILFSLYFFSALRFEVGCDWPNYLLNFATQKHADFTYAFKQPNPAHWVLLEIMDYFNLDYMWLNIVTSGIFFMGLHTIARRSASPITVLVLAFPVLILNMPMAAVKQAAGIGLMCFAFNAFIDKKLVLFAFFVGAASVFHGSALVFALLIPFMFGGYTVSNLVLSVLLMVPGMFALLATEAAEIAGFRYFTGDRTAGGAIFRVGLLFVTGVFYMSFLSSRWKEVFPDSHKLVSLLAIGMIGLGAIYPLSSVVADRFGYYFNIPQLMIYAAVPWLYKQGQAQLIKITPYLALFVLFFAWTLMSDHYKRCYLPYSTMLSARS